MKVDQVEALRSTIGDHPATRVPKEGISASSGIEEISRLVFVGFRVIRRIEHVVSIDEFVTNTQQ